MSGSEEKGNTTESEQGFEAADGSELLVLSDGSPRLGVIDEEMAKEAGIPAGEIRANVNTIRHIEEQHGAQIKQAGYEHTFDLIIDAIENYNEIRQGGDASLLLVKHGVDSSPLAAVKLLKEGDIWGVNSAWIARNDYVEKKKLLSARSATLAADPDSGLALQTGSQNRQGGTGLSARQKSSISDLSISPPQGSVNPPRRA